MATNFTPAPQAAAIVSHQVPPVTFRHLVAGSTYISRKGKTCVFAGRKGALGFYTTTDSAEVEELTELAGMPNVQIDIEASPAATKFSKPVDPTLAVAAEEAAAPAALEATPEVANARNNIAAVIAKSAKG